jgi:Tfp pilus assembly protein PilN
MMQRLSLDLIKSPLPVWPGMLVLGIAMAGALFSYLQYLAVSERNTTLQVELAQLGAESQKSHVANQASTLSPAEMEAEDKRAREVAASLLLPWHDLFAALESAAHSDVALLAIEPDHKKQQVRITAEARDFGIVVGYLKRLDHAPQLKLVRLVRYEVREDDKQHPLRFSVEASWRLPT